VGFDDERLKSAVIRRRLVALLVGLYLLAGCAPTKEDGVVLPAGANVISVSPNLEWITYEGSGVVWLAPLPCLDEPVTITPSGGDGAAWSMHTTWIPDSSGVLLKSFAPEEDKETWWLVKVIAPNERHPLCTLSSGERVPLWSPTSDMIALISRGGAVTLMRADGSGCEELPIPGLVMNTPSLSWSPDGKEIAYVELPPEGPASAEMRSFNIQTHEIRTIYGSGGLPIWFAGGEAIALMGWYGAVPVVRADGSGLIGSVEIPEGYRIASIPDSKPSPDGSKLALSLEPEQSVRIPDAVGILDRDTMAIRVMESPSYLEIIGWTWDGEHLVILVSGPTQRLMLEELDTTP
jgi:hypothetical protein